LPSPVNILNNPLVASLSAFLSRCYPLGRTFQGALPLREE
jgi:hypothetical protein